MLALACPLRDETGKILKWYGTNTDIHDSVMAKIEAASNKSQLLTVLSHPEVNLFSIDKNRKITMIEGGMTWQSNGAMIADKSLFVGQDIIEVTQAIQTGGIPGKNLQASWYPQNTGANYDSQSMRRMCLIF